MTKQRIEHSRVGPAGASQGDAPERAGGGVPGRQTSDVVSRILAACPADAHDLDTAEGRLAWDNRLRAEMAKVDDPNLRQHASAIIKAKRHEAYTGLSGYSCEIRSFDDVDLRKRLAALEQRILELEAANRTDRGAS